MPWPREAAERQLVRGDVLFNEGDPPDSLYLVTRGRIAIAIANPIDRRESVVALMEPGDLFGELGLLDDGPRSAMARALEPSGVLAVPFGPVREMFDEHPRLLWNFTRLLAKRLRAMDEVLADSVFLDVTGRTAKRLLELANGTDQFQLPVTQEELAGMVGASRERVNKAIASFIRLGWLEQHDRHLQDHPARPARAARPLTARSCVAGGARRDDDEGDDQATRPRRRSTSPPAEPRPKDLSPVVRRTPWSDAGRRRAGTRRRRPPPIAASSPSIRFSTMSGHSSSSRRGRASCGSADRFRNPNRIEHRRRGARPTRTVITFGSPHRGLAADASRPTVLTRRSTTTTVADADHQRDRRPGRSAWPATDASGRAWRRRSGGSCCGCTPVIAIIVTTPSSIAVTMLIAERRTRPSPRPDHVVSASAVVSSVMMSSGKATATITEDPVGEDRAAA